MQFNVENKGIDQFLQTRFISGAFLQSTVWQEFLSAQKLRNWRINILDRSKTVCTCLFYEKHLPLEKTYLYSPKGPIFAAGTTPGEQKEALRLLLGKLRDVTAYTERYTEIFFRSELESAAELVTGLTKAEDVQPRETWVLYLDKTEEELLAATHSKTRYNINLAKRHGVNVRFSTGQQDLEKFLELLDKTAERNQIAPHPKEYYRKLFSTLSAKNYCYLAVAEKANDTLAINMMIDFGPATTYLHGASDYNFRQLMAPHLLQWQSIIKAQQNGKKVYDFWGINPADNSKPGWEGFSRFKRSFGGARVASAGAYDMIYDKGLYKLYNLLRRFRKLI